MVSQRNTAIDIMKGVTIILMIIGHWYILCNLTGNIPYKILHKIIYSFHMPLFFIIAGYFYRRGGRELLWKDLKRFIIPYWFTAIVIILFVIGTSLYNVDYSYKINRTIEAAFWGTGWTHNAPRFGNVPIIGAIWFLLALFWSKQIFALLENCICRKVNDEKIVSIFFTYIDCHIVYIPMSFNQGASALVFYCIGYYCKFINYDIKYLYISIVLLLLNLPFSGLSISICYYQCYPLNVLGASSTTLCVYLLCKWMNNFKILSLLMSWCGRNSMLILCVHLFSLNTNYVYPTITNPMLCLMFYFFYAMLGSWLLSKIVFIKYIFQIK